MKILIDHGFTLLRQGATSHRQFEGFVEGQRFMVTASGQDGDDIKPGTLASMKRQSGLPKRTFR